jgi:uncharacterized protein
MYQRSITISAFLAFFTLLLFPATDARAQEQEYEAMEGVESVVKTAFDFRVGDSEAALGHLNLIHAMLDDPSMMRGGQKPEMVVVFIGPSVELVSTKGMGMGPGPGSRSAIADKISAMDEDGVRFEICMTAAHALEVTPESILPEIVQVGNGWISLIGYQQNGYSLIADF